MAHGRRQWRPPVPGRPSLLLPWMHAPPCLKRTSSSWKERMLPLMWPRRCVLGRRRACVCVCRGQAVGRATREPASVTPLLTVCSWRRRGGCAAECGARRPVVLGHHAAFAVRSDDGNSSSCPLHTGCWASRARLLCFWGACVSSLRGAPVRPLRAPVCLCAGATSH